MSNNNNNNKRKYDSSLLNTITKRNKFPKSLKRKREENNYNYNNSINVGSSDK